MEKSGGWQIMHAFLENIRKELGYEVRFVPGWRPIPISYWHTEEYSYMCGLFDTEDGDGTWVDLVFLRTNWVDPMEAVELSRFEPEAVGRHNHEYGFFDSYYQIASPQIDVIYTYNGSKEQEHTVSGLHLFDHEKFSQSFQFRPGQGFLLFSEVPKGLKRIPPLGLGHEGEKIYTSNPPTMFGVQKVGGQYIDYPLQQGDVAIYYLVGFEDPERSTGKTLFIHVVESEAEKGMLREKEKG